MLKHGGDINAIDNMQQTALHWAAVRGGIAVTDVLLQNGARVEAADINGYRVIISLVFSNSYSFSVEKDLFLCTSNKCVNNPSGFHILKVLIE